MSQTNRSASGPTVLSFNVHDATGASGIAADVEAIVSQGCHVSTVVTCLSVRDSQSLSSLIPVGDDIIVQSARAVLEDSLVDAIKVGLVGSEESVEAIQEILLDYPDIPVVFDPMLTAGKGVVLATDTVIDALRELLIPRANLLTLNSLEAAMLFPEADNPSAMMQGLMDAGCDHILLSGRREPGETVVNTLYHNMRIIEQYEWPRLQGDYYGAGCTLSASLAALLAVGLDIIESSAEAQNYCWQSLKYAKRFGMGQSQPFRFYWMYEDDTD